jgi:AraC-like DNA-binding protein
VLERQMRTTSLAPSPALRSYIQRFLIVEYTAGQTNKLLPSTGLVAAFRFKGHCLLNGSAVPNALVTGLWDTARILTHSGNCSNVLAMFTPTGAAALLEEPVENLFNGTMPLEFEIRRSSLDRVEEELAESRHHARRIEVIERFLLNKLHRAPDGLVSAAVARIYGSRGGLRIATLARHMGISQSALERRFRREVGTSPKKFATIVRLRNVVQLRQAGATFTDVAHASGYADQAHFIKDFRRFAGEPPESFFETSSGFC